MNPSDIEGPHLFVVTGSRAGLNIKLEAGESGQREWTIGSARDRDVQFQDRGVAAEHAVLIDDGERWKVLDQTSESGTYVNDQRSRLAWLASGDHVCFGPVECVFRTVPAGAALRREARGASASNMKMVIISAAAFAVAIALLVAVYQIVM